MVIGHRMDASDSIFISSMTISSSSSGPLLIYDFMKYHEKNHEQSRQYKKIPNFYGLMNLFKKICELTHWEFHWAGLDLLFSW